MLALSGIRNTGVCMNQPWEALLLWEARLAAILSALCKPETIATSFADPSHKSKASHGFTLSCSVED